MKQVIISLIVALGFNYASANTVNFNPLSLRSKLTLDCEVSCSSNVKLEKLYSRNAQQSSQLSEEVISQLQKVAADQAQIWADTILEGDYYADGNTKLDIVYGVYNNNELVGYQIQYSESAWSTANCSFDGENLNLLNSCQKGRISEASFVSLDLKVFSVDDNKLAEFIEE